MKSPIRILYLEDDPEDAASIQSALEAEGVPCATTCVQCRDDFVAALEDGGIDLVLSDSALPAFDGMSALSIVRARWPVIPLIFVSGTHGEERAIDLLKSGATDYVLKDRLGRLAPAVRRAMQEVEERTEHGLREEKERNQQIKGELEQRVLERTAHLETANKSLVKTNDRLNAIILAARDAIIFIDSQPAIVLFNPAAEKMFAVSAGEAVGKSIDRFIPPGKWNARPVHVGNGPEIGITARHLVGVRSMIGLRANGQEFPIEATISPVEVEGERLYAVVLRDITERTRVEEELRASREELRALAAQIQQAREEERTHAAREIHDVLAQELTGLKMEVAWLGRKLAEPMETLEQNVLLKRVDAMKELTDQASRSVQRIASELRPVILDSLGLCAAVEWVAAEFQKRTETRCDAHVPNKGLALDRDRSTAVFRILQESLTNISRHAQASKVEIRLWQAANEIILTVSDNGRGILSSEMKDPLSLGLLGMRERASLLDGRCAIRPQGDGGTMVEVRLPIGKAHENV